MFSVPEIIQDKVICIFIIAIILLLWFSALAQKFIYIPFSQNKQSSCSCPRWTNRDCSYPSILKKKRLPDTHHVKQFSDTRAQVIQDCDSWEKGEDGVKPRTVQISCLETVYKLENLQTAGRKRNLCRPLQSCSNTHGSFGRWSCLECRVLVSERSCRDWVPCSWNQTRRL